MDKLRVIFAFVQLVAFALTLAYAIVTRNEPRGRFPVYKPKMMYSNGTRTHFMEEYGAWDLRWLVMVFFLLSCVGQTVVIWLDDWVAISARYIEYSLSASVMLVAIALTCGIADVYTLVVLAACMFATNMLGLGAHIALGVREKEGAWTLFVAGSVVLAAAYGMVFWSFMVAIDAAPDFTLKPLIKAIVASQMALFCCFAAVQLLQLAYDLSAATAARAYDVLSVVCKLLLGLLIMIPVLNNQWNETQAVNGTFVKAPM